MAHELHTYWVNIFHSHARPENTTLIRREYSGGEKMKYLKVVLVILAIVFATSSTAVANLVVNGGFETGDLPDGLKSGPPGIGTLLIATPHSGSYHATTNNWPESGSTFHRVSPQRSGSRTRLVSGSQMRTTSLLMSLSRDGTERRRSNYWT